jgi:hypothetical protein
MTAALMIALKPDPQQPVAVSDQCFPRCSRIAATRPLD